ncbi:hypothetical protein Q8A73_010809 [Channa argus]|nr:hypothetical protein Q8A73_010809 [Channa argus]
MLLLYVFNMVGCQIRYSVPEEMRKGSVIGNVAQDLGLDLKRLRYGRARIVTGESVQYTELNTDKGILVVNERIDREQLCGDITPCSFSFELGTTIAVLNIKDADSEENGQIKCSIRGKLPFKIESFLTNYYNLISDQHFDRESLSDYNITITATDCGSPPLSSLTTLHLKISDVNDNAPVFDKNSYYAQITENNSPGVSIFAVSARNSDWNQNARVSYLLEDTRVSGSPDSAFVSLNTETGVISAVRSFDYEQIKELQLVVKAQDGGSPPLTSNVTVKILIQDQNDNPPQVLYPVQTGGSQVAEMVPRSADVGYLVTKVVAVDVDSGQNAWLSYKLQKATDRALFEVGLQNGEITTIRQITDNDAVKQRLTVIVEDNGQPSRSATVIVNLAVADSFPEVLSEFTDFAHDKEYNDNLTFYLFADDPDENQNARISYILDVNNKGGSTVSDYVSVCAESGVIEVVRSFDYEQIKQLVFVVIAQDGGSPPLTSNVTVKILVQDQNDNPPQVLYPVQTGGSQVAEMVPRSADVGYLVTKVVAVDVDSGQNAWLSYKLQKATDRALFEVGLQNGEIRTTRQVTDKDAVKQRLTVIVEDNGQPSRSATVIVNLAVADSFPEVLSEFTDFAHDKEYNDNLTFYLVLALAVVSFLFIMCLVVIISVKIYRWRQSRVLYHSSLPVIPYYPPRYSDTLGTGTLQHVYNYEVCRTTDSRKSDCKLGRAGSQNVLIMDPSSSGTMQRIQSEKSILDEPDSPLEVSCSM